MFVLIDYKIPTPFSIYFSSIRGASLGSGIAVSYTIFVFDDIDSFKEYSPLLSFLIGGFSFFQICFHN